MSNQAQHQEPTPFEELHGHIQAMLARSEKYQREAEMDAEIREGEKHARVCSVLRELDRIARGIQKRQP